MMKYSFRNAWAHPPGDAVVPYTRVLLPADDVPDLACRLNTAKYLLLTGPDRLLPSPMTCAGFEYPCGVAEYHNVERALGRNAFSCAAKCECMPAANSASPV